MTLGVGGQTDYSMTPDIGLEGGLASPNHEITPMLNADIVTIPYGRVVVQGTGDQDVLLPTDVSGSFAGDVVGLTVHTHAKESNDPAIDGYTVGEPLNVLRKGPMIVVPEDSPVARGRVYFRFATGAGGTEMGALRSDSDGGTAHHLRGAEWKCGVDGKGFAVVDINLPA